MLCPGGTLKSKRKSQKPRTPRAGGVGSSLLRLMVAGGITLAFCLGGLAWYVDRMVQHRLAHPLQPRTSAILGDSRRFRAGVQYQPSQLHTELRRRNYRELAERPARPGEYRMTVDALEIIPHEFVTASGEKTRSTYVRLGLARGDLLNADGVAIDEFQIEPEVIAHLATAEVKASHFRQLHEIPELVQQAVLAIEDERFRSHVGLDVIGITRALYANLRAGRVVQGGSTITQQLAKNLFFSPKRTIVRKVLEALAAISLEVHLSKDQILELYLNQVYLGQQGSIAIHGVPEAARAFFGKELEELNIAEAALLAGVIKAPSSYSPFRHPTACVNRQRVVLKRLREAGGISNAQYQSAVRQKIALRKSTAYRRVAPHFLEALKGQLAQHVDLETATSAGIRVHTGLSLGMQECAEAAVQRGVESLQRTYKALRRPRQPLQAGLVALEPHTGKVRAWVGGPDYSRNQFDHVGQAFRQIGSTIKPFLYLTALDAELNAYKVATATSILSDSPQSVELVTKEQWVPENYDKEFRGDVTLRYALENSLNLPAVYTAQRVGIGAVARTLRLFHVAQSVPEVPALALGAAETTLLRLTAAYGALANGGRYVPPRLFLAIADDSTVLHTEPYAEERAGGESAVFVVTDILRGALTRGTGRTVVNSGFTEPAAGKTGTSNEARDAWFVGYTPNLVAGVWVGFDDNQPIGLTGSVAAAPIWSEFMKCARPFHDTLEFIPPPGVVSIEIDGVTGDVAGSDCPDEARVREVFVRGTEPTRRCQHGARYDDEAPSWRERQRKEFDTEPTPIERRRRRTFWDEIFG